MARSRPRLSGLVFVDKVHDVDSSVYRTPGSVSGQQKGVNAMRHQNTVFHGVLKQVPWSEFDSLVEKHRADFRVRTLTTKDQFVALVYGQLSGAASLREIVSGLGSHAARLYHVGAAPARRSTLADANALRPWEFFSELFGLMVKRAHRGLRRKIGDATYLIDSTGVRLNSLSARWARFSKGVCGGKVHVIYDPDADRPTFFSVSAANVNDITEAKAMPIEDGATYVFDLGYHDFGWWAELAEAGCRIVTRFKKNTNLTVTKKLSLPKNSDILSDKIGYLSERMARNRKNPFQASVREVCVKTDTGKVLRILTNDLEASAQEIADLYKRRWAIELFFRWIKQVLKITRFLGTSENAVRIQIAVALITFLLLRTAQTAQKIIQSPLAFARLIRANLMHRRRLDRLLESDPTPPPRAGQLVIQWL
jgi:IS4 transposase